MADLYARTFDEAHLYMDLRPCECGESDFDRESVLSTAGGSRTMTYRGSCAGCGRQREFAFRLADRRSAADGDSRYGDGAAPSRLLDAGEWVAVSDFMAATARSMLPADGGFDGYGDEELIGIHELLSSAAAATQESAKFLPAGAERVPDTAIWSDSGRLLLDVYPDRLTRDNLAAEVAQRRQALAAFEDRFADATEGDG
jgi:hypothetical protein